VRRRRAIDQLALFGEQPPDVCKAQTFVPPRGPGRCRDCGWHTTTQGHNPDCPLFFPPFNPQQIERRLGLTPPKPAVSDHQPDIAEFDPHGFFVYVLWDDRRRLYVGKSTNVLQRLGQHMGKKNKRDLVTRVQFIRCKSERAMRDKETQLIRMHRPPMNTHVPGDYRDRCNAKARAGYQRRKQAAS
jgi:predicted GIY-YIG superfamily endonuclease